MCLYHVIILFFLSQEPFSLAVNIVRNCVFGPKGYNLLGGRKYFQLGPQRSPKYNPNYGYAPYWPGGDWVFERFDTTTEKRVGSACGVDCSELFVEFGEVCGRSLNYTHKTFSNYCELQNEDCRGREKWLIAYRGKCQEELKTYPTKQNEMATRAMKYVDDFEANNPSTKTYRIYKG